MAALVPLCDPGLRAWAKLEENRALGKWQQVKEKTSFPSQPGALGRGWLVKGMRASSRCTFPEKFLTFRPRPPEALSRWSLSSSRNW